MTALACGIAAFATAPVASGAECDPIMPTSELVPGMSGTGWTVMRGRTPEPFSVTVLGVMRDGAGPGRDMIVVEASGAPISAAGGIWAGISGSPVYVGGRLIGGVAFGFSTSSFLAGVTPAPDMAALLSLRATSTSTFLPRRVVLPRALTRDIARRTDEPVGQVGVLTQLRIPFGISGLNARGMREARKWIAKRDLPLIPFSGSVASRALAAPVDPVEPGDNFAAVAAYGDVTLSGMGTTTYVCAGRALAFGHPFHHAGAGPAGANAADAFAIVTDPVLGPFKLASVAETIGVVDQDRLAGLRVRLGEAPPTTPIRSVIAAVDSGLHRNGATDVVVPELTSMATALHVVSNIDVTYDAIRKGTAALNWTIEGTRANGAPWRLVRGDLIASTVDVAVEAADTVAFELDDLELNPFEEVRITNVRIEGSIDDAVRRYTLAKVLVAKGRGGFRPVRRAVGVRPGMLLRFRVQLRPYGSGAMRRVGFGFRVPRGAPSFGQVQIGGGMMMREGGCPPDEPECEDGFGTGSFDALLRSIQTAPRSDVVIGRMRLGESSRAREKRRRVDGVVVGMRMIELRFGGGGGGPTGPEGDAEPVPEEDVVGP